MLKECRDTLAEIYNVIEKMDGKLDEEQVELVRDIIHWCISIINLCQVILFKNREVKQ